MRKSFIITVALFALWLLLSGMLDHTLLIALGVLSSALAALLSWRMEQRAGQTASFFLNPLQCALYVPWLAREIAVANLEVARLVLSPKQRIRPTVVTLQTSQSNELTQAIYANSITLTPGTVSIEVGGGEIEVHCLTRAGAEALRAGEMDRRVTRLEGRR